MKKTRNHKKLRVICFSCQGSRLPAEVLEALRRRRPELLDEITGVVLSRPKQRKQDTTTNEVDGRNRLGKRLTEGLQWRFNHLRFVTGLRLRRTLSRYFDLPFRHIEDFCHRAALEPYYTQDINSPESIEKIKSYRPDLILIMTFHHILERPVIEIPRIATLNVHCSLLPRYRGADPIGEALADGAEETGVTIHWVDEGIDTGDIVAQAAVPVAGDRTESQLRPKLARAAAELLIDVLEQARSGELPRRAQTENVQGAVPAGRNFRAEISSG